MLERFICISLSLVIVYYTVITTLSHFSSLNLSFSIRLWLCCGRSPNIYVDNQSAIKLIQNPVAHDQTKHIDIKYHFIQNVEAKGTIKVEYCPTNNQVADVLTKLLSRGKHKCFMEQMGLRNA